MHETLTQSPESWETSDGIRAAALRAEAWAGEPFLRPDDEDPETTLRSGSALRHALDDALSEIEAGLTEPSSEWKVRYALMLGLERVLSEKPPHLASGTELRRHQVDALAGMLTELIAAVEKREANGNGNGNGASAEEIVEEEDEEDDDLPAELDGADPEERELHADVTGPIPAPSAGTGSGIRPRPARRSPPPGSSRPRAPKAS